jgi:hypothetical protein
MGQVQVLDYEKPARYEARTQVVSGKATGRRGVPRENDNQTMKSFLRETFIWVVTVALAVVTGWIWVQIISNL